MSIVTLPNALKYNQFAWGVNNYEMEETADSTGDSAARIIGPPRWTAHFTSNDDMDLAEAARWEWLMLQLRGDNCLALYDIVRLAPQGTMRGTPTLAANIAVGDTSATITASGTLKQGDRLGFGTGLGTSQLIIVAADAAASSGTITFTFNNPARIAFSSGTSVIWDKPVAYFRRTNRAATLGRYSATSLSQGGFSLDLMERFG